MKIGLLIDDTLDTTDGVQQYVLMLGDWLTNNGHKVHYLAGYSERKDLANLHSLSKNISVRFNRNKLSIPLGASKKQLNQLLSWLNLDVVHVQMPCSPQLSGRLIGLLSPHTAVVGTFHVLPYSLTEKLGAQILAKIIRPVLGRLDRVVSVSSPASKSALTLYGLSSTVIPNPVVVPKNHSTKTKNQNKTIVFLGRLVKRKGVMELLHAYKHARDSNKINAKLVIGGTGYLKDEVNNFIIHNNLSNFVRCIGFVPEEEKYKLLAQADLAVFPSIGGESFGIVLTEAMAAGAKVVIGGDNPGYRSVLTDSRTLFNPNDTQKFAATIEEFLLNQDLSDEINKYQQELLSNFNINNVGPRILKEYRLAIAKRNKAVDNK